MAGGLSLMRAAPRRLGLVVGHLVVGHSPTSPSVRALEAARLSTAVTRAPTAPASDAAPEHRCLHVLTKKQHDQYATHGYCIVDDVIPPPLLQRLIDAAHRIRRRVRCAHPHPRIGECTAHALRREHRRRSIFASHRSTICMQRASCTTGSSTARAGRHQQPLARLSFCW